MQRSLLLVLFSLLLIACGNDDDVITPNPQNEVPTVQSAATYDVIVEEDVVYGEGLSHESLNSAEASTMDLKLDVYTPDNESENRPVYLFIHGGGFTGGSKQAASIVSQANYYAARGWVFVSIDYRVARDLGTVPQAWVDYAANLPSEQLNQYYAIYPAQRDAKAAMRWLVANADRYNINTDYITVGGGSAGAITAVTLGVSNPEDFRDEIDSSTDPSLATTNSDQSYTIQTIIDYWGSDVALEALELVYGHQRFDATDPPLFIAHGTEDPTVLFSEALELESYYQDTGVPYVLYDLQGLGHGVWNATVDNKRLEELAFDYIIEQQKLTVE